jgi:hypothetical protein
MSVSSSGNSLPNHSTSLVLDARIDCGVPSKLPKKLVRGVSEPIK